MSVNINGGSMRIEASVHNALTMHKVESNNFVKLNDAEEDQNSFSRTIASRDMLYEAKSISGIQGNLSNLISDFKSAQNSFIIVKENVTRIQELVQQAYDGVIVGTDLDDGQEEINSLVNEITVIAEKTIVNGRNIFDGNFDSSIKTGLKNSDILDLNFIDLIDLRVETTDLGNIASGATSPLDEITISDTIESNGEVTGLADVNTVDNMNIIEDNIIKMEAILNSKTQRLENEFSGLQREKEAKLDSKIFLDDKLIADTYFNPYAIENQFSNPYNAVNLLP